LPRFRIDHLTSVRDNGEYRITGTIACDNGPPETSIDVTIETSADETTQSCRVSGAVSQLSMAVKYRPKRVIVDKYANTSSSNVVLDRMRDALPIAFGTQSFTVGKDVYAHWRTGVVAAAENPLNSRYAVVALCGLSADATLGLPAEFVAKIENNCDLLLLPH